MSNYYNNVSKVVNLMMFFDDKYFNSALTCLSSILSNTESEIHLFFDGNLNENNYKKIVCFHDRLTVSRINGVQQKSELLFKTGSWLPSITLCRLFGPYYIKEGIDRLIYLDSDIIVKSDLFLFQNLDLQGNIIGASGEKRFNAGVILYDMVLLLSRVKEETFINYLNSLERMPYYADQDILNDVFKDSYFNIGNEYNYRAWNTFLWKNPLKHNAKIIHYLGRIKPDNYKWIEWKANKPFWEYAIKIYGWSYRIRIAIKSFFWYPVALYRRFRYKTGAKD